jgi:MFS family permease
VPVAVLAAAFLFNLGQGVLRPSLPLYLQHVFGANYRMVTLIPVVFGVGRWVATLPTGYLLDRLGRRTLMAAGLIVIATSDLVSIVVTVFASFLVVRGIAGMGWAMFGTVATTLMVDRSAKRRRGRAVSLLLMSESVGLLIGTVAGGWLYQGVGTASPFVCEAACMVLAAVVVAGCGPSHLLNSLGSPAAAPRPGTVVAGCGPSHLLNSLGSPAAAPRPATPARESAATPEAIASDRRLLRDVVRTPGVVLVSVTSAVLAAVQTGVLVFLFPLYLVEHGRLEPTTVGYVIGLSVLGRVAALWIGGSVSDRHDRMSVLSLGLLGYGLVLGTLILITDPLLLGLWSVMIGAGGGFVAGLPTSIVGDRVAAPLHGVAIGWLRTVTDTGMLLGPLAMGALADAVHLTAPFLCGAVLVCALAWGSHRMAVRPQSSGG